MPQSHLVVWRLRLPSFQMLSLVQAHQPPVPHTIVQAFSKQRVAKDKAEVKAKAHADIRQRIVRFLASPASHNDPLRTLSDDQLNELTDEQLMHQAF